MATNKQLKAQYAKIDQTALSDKAKDTLRKIRLANANFRSEKEEAKALFEKFYNQLEAKKPEAIIGSAAYKAKLKKEREDAKESKAKGSERDAGRPAKRFGWRMKGRHNYKTPTPADIRAGRAYYEARPNRADKNRKGYPMLADGGMTHGMHQRKFAHGGHLADGVYVKGAPYKVGKVWAQDIVEVDGDRTYTATNYAQKKDILVREHKGYAKYSLADKEKKKFEYGGEIENLGIPENVFNDLALNYVGVDPDELTEDQVVNAYQGTYRDSEQFAEQLVDDLGIMSFNNPTYYLYVTETDKRILSNELAENYVSDLRYEEDYERIFEEANMDMPEEDSPEFEKEYENALYAIEAMQAEEYYQNLSDDLVQMMEDFGYNLDESIPSFVRVDYEKLASELEYDYYFVEYDGEVYVFNQYELYECGGYTREKEEEEDEEDGVTRYYFEDEAYEYAKGGKVVKMSGDEIYAKADNMSESEYEELYSKASQEEKDLARRLENLGDEKKVALITAINSVAYRKGNYDNTTWDLYRYAEGGKVEAADFDSLKKGDTITIAYGDSISRNKEATLKVKSKNLVNKGKASEQEKITFENVDNPTGAKYYAYKRPSGHVSFAHSDMAIGNVHIVNKYAKGGSTDKGEKLYYVSYNVGKSKYVINSHDGVKTHRDGSPFYDVETFRNKVAFNKALNELKAEGYKERTSFAKGGSTGLYASDDAFLIQVKKDGVQVDEVIVRARNIAEARMEYEDYHEGRMEKKHGTDLEIYIMPAPSKMAEGGYMAEGEDYEYENIYGLEQADFNKLVDKAHKWIKTQSSDDHDDFYEYENELREKYGRKPVMKTVTYIINKHAAEAGKRFHSKPKMADGGAVKGKFQVGDEGMFEGGEIVIKNIKGNYYEYSYLNDDGEPYFQKFRAPKSKFENQFRKFPKMAKGGQVKGFEALSKKVAKNYEGKPVPAKYQNEYGKTYDKEEAKEVGDKVAAKVYRQQLAAKGKMAHGGELQMGIKQESKEHGMTKAQATKTAKDHLKEDPKYYTKLKKAGLKKGGTTKKAPKRKYATEKSIFGIAKDIRKDGESWQSAVKRAAVINKSKQK